MCPSPGSRSSTETIASWGTEVSGGTSRSASALRRSTRHTSRFSSPWTASASPSRGATTPKGCPATCWMPPSTSSRVTARGSSIPAIGSSRRGDADMERTRAPCPAALASWTDVAGDADLAALFTAAQSSSDAVLSLSAPLADRYGIRSHMAMALHPKEDHPYLFCLHQCSQARRWTDDEQRLFREIAGRLTDALSSLLAIRNLSRQRAPPRSGAAPRACRLVGARLPHRPRLAVGRGEPHLRRGARRHATVAGAVARA